MSAFTQDALHSCWIGRPEVWACGLCPGCRGTAQEALHTPVLAMLTCESVPSNSGKPASQWVNSLYRTTVSSRLLSFFCTRQNREKDCYWTAGSRTKSEICELIQRPLSSILISWRTLQSVCSIDSLKHKARQTTCSLPFYESSIPCKLLCENPAAQHGTLERLSCTLYFQFPLAFSYVGWEALRHGTKYVCSGCRMKSIPSQLCQWPSKDTDLYCSPRPCCSGSAG